MTTPSPTISVRTNGRDIGFIIIRDAGVEAFSPHGKSLGIFPSRDDAARELWRHACSGWISLGEAAARLVRRLGASQEVA